MASYKSDADMVDSSIQTIPESEGELEEIEDAEQNLTVENEEEVEDDEQNGLAVDDEVIMELVECIRSIRAVLRERVFICALSCISSSRLSQHVLRARSIAAYAWRTTLKGKNLEELIVAIYTMLIASKSGSSATTLALFARGKRWLVLVGLFNLKELKRLSETYK